MTLTTVKIDGMMCSMCEAHVNDALRHAFSPKKVSASHTKGVCEIVSETPPDAEKLRTVIGDMGYRVLEISCAPYEKKGFFSRFKK